MRRVQTPGTLAQKREASLQQTGGKQGRDKKKRERGGQDSEGKGEKGRRGKRKKKGGL